MEQRIRQVAREVGFQHEWVISPVALDADEFENGSMSESRLVVNIMGEGDSRVMRKNIEDPIKYRIEQAHESL